MLIYEERVAMPMIPILLEEMGELKIINDKKVDHPFFAKIFFIFLNKIFK